MHTFHLKTILIVSIYSYKFLLFYVILFNMYTCFHCDSDRYQNNNATKVLDHISSSHLQFRTENKNKLPEYRCIKTNCKTFRSRSGILKHIKTNCVTLNSLSLNNSTLTNNSPSATNNCSLSLNNNPPVEVETEIIVDEDENVAANHTISLFQKNVQDFFDYLKRQGLPESSINSIHSYQEKLMNNVIDLTKECKSEKISTELKKYRSAHLRKSNFKKHRHYFSVRQFSLKVVRTKSRKNSRIVYSNKQCRFSYIDINKTIEIIFKNKSFRHIYDTYNNDHSCNRKIMEGYCCGSKFKKSPFFKKYPKGVQIQIYYDDFGVNNALGNKSRNQKLGAIYFSIKNLPNFFLSKQNHIYLVCLFKVKHLKGNPKLFNVILSKISSDINILQKRGFEVDGQQICGQLTSLCYDNLGANTICGMNRSFNASWYCRVCKLSKESCRIHYRVPTSMFRNGVESKRLLCRRGDKLGLVFQSKLNEIVGFNVFDNVTADPMHDVLEGGIPIVLLFFFNHLISNNILTANAIENLILNYNFPSLESKNKIQKINITDSVKFGLYASQYRSLIFHIPFIFHNCKDKVADTVWNSVTYIIEITRISFSYRIPYEVIEQFEDKVEYFLKHLLDNGLILTPKLHMLTHYTELMRRMGPIAHYNTLHYEHFHQQFIKMTKNLKIFKNLTKTLSDNYLQSFIIKWGKSDFIETEICGKKLCSPEDKLSNYECYLNGYDLSDCQELKSVNKGFLYKEGLLLVKIINNLYDFYYIVKVLKSEDDFKFLVRKCKTLCFNIFFQCFEIEFCDDYTIIPYSLLFIRTTFNYVKFADKYFVIFQSIIC